MAMGRGRGWEKWGRADPPPTQGPGTHLFHLLGREGTGSEVDQVCPNPAPHPHRGVPKAAAQGQAGGRACPPTVRGTRPPGHSVEHKGARDTGSGAVREAELTEKREGKENEKDERS